MNTVVSVITYLDTIIGEFYKVIVNLITKPSHAPQTVLSQCGISSFL